MPLLEAGTKVGGKRGWPIRRRRTMKKYVSIVLLAGFLAAGCNDPASVKRIADRNQRLNNQLADFQKMEAGRPRRVEDAFRTANKWWLQDSNRFRERVPQVGDYFW